MNTTNHHRIQNQYQKNNRHTITVDRKKERKKRKEKPLLHRTYLKAGISLHFASGFVLDAYPSGLLFSKIIDPPSQNAEEEKEEEKI